MCAIEGAEYSDVWLEEHPTARKPWKCIECGRRIAAGETYLRTKSLYDGRWDTLQTCQHCDAAADWLRDVCGGYLAHGLFEELDEHWDEGYHSVGFGRLIVGMKRKWKDGADPVPAGVCELAEAMVHAKVHPGQTRPVATVTPAGGVL